MIETRGEKPKEKAKNKKNKGAKKEGWCELLGHVGHEKLHVVLSAEVVPYPLPLLVFLTQMPPTLTVIPSACEPQNVCS